MLHNCSAKPSNLERYIFLMALQDQNETLFYHTVQQYIKDLMPIIYTPTVGEAAMNYGSIFRRPRGLYVTADDKGQVAKVLRNWAGRTPRVIVATDGGRVLGPRRSRGQWNDKYPSANWLSTRSRVEYIQRPRCRS